MTDPGPPVEDAALKDAIRELLARRAPTSSICPSDVARRVAPEDWRRLMAPVRRAAADLVDTGEVQITQRGEVVDPASARGPIRIRWTRPQG